MCGIFPIVILGAVVLAVVQRDGSMWQEAEEASPIGTRVYRR